MNLKQSIRRILREESNIPKVIARRVTLDELDKIFERSLDDNTLDYENPLSIMYGRSYKAFAKVVIDDMITELESEFGIPFIDDTDKYNEKYREPLFRHYAPIIKDRYIDITSNNVDESVLKEEANPIMRRVFRRIGQEKFDSIFDSGLQTMITRFEQNRHNFHSMTFSKFRDSVIPYVIIELCLTLEDVCLDPNYYEQTLDFLLNNYSGRIKEKWEEINSGNVNESVLNEERVGGKKKLKGLVDEFGLLEASKMIGMSIAKLAEVTNTPIDSDTANQILVEMMNNGELKTKYKDFEIHASSNDVFYWEGMVKTGHFHDDMIENITIAATPFWDGVKYTPVEIEWFTLFNYYGMTVYETSGDGSFYKELKHQTNFESVDELLNWYEEFYLPEVYNLAMNTLLPKMHKLADYEIKQRG